MSPDKYSAVWVSHSSISDFLSCPRVYYLKNVYKDPKTGHKIQIMSPPLALGQAVHQVLESLSTIPTDQRFKVSLVEKLDKFWPEITGKKGGFTSKETEDQYYQRGKEMLNKVVSNPGPLNNLAIKIKQDLPYYWLSEQDNIILCGKIDWLEYNQEADTVHIIDFKTSKKVDNGLSLQLPIYYLLASNCQTKKVVKASYWYLELHDEPVEQKLPSLNTAFEQVITIAKQIKLARQLNRFRCSKTDGCSFCKPFERIIKGEGELVGSSMGRDAYIFDGQKIPDSEIL